MRTFTEAVRRHGLLATTRLALAKGRGYRGARRRLQDGRRFDEHYGIRTAEIWPVADLALESRHRDQAVRYEASPPDTVRRLIRSLPIEFERYTFVDVGAGMGRVVLLASTFPFKAIVGVEFAPELVSIARSNIQAFPKGEVCAASVEVLCIDAVDFVLPEDSLVLYLFNPFAVSVLSEFLDNVVGVVSRRPRDVYAILLSTREAAETIARYGFEQIAPHIHRLTSDTARS